MEVEEGVVGGLPSIEMNEGIVSTFAEQDFVGNKIYSRCWQSLLAFLFLLASYS